MNEIFFGREAFYVLCSNFDKERAIIIMKFGKIVMYICP